MAVHSHSQDHHSHVMFSTPCVHPVPLWLCTAAATWQSAIVADNQADYQICAVWQESIEAVQEKTITLPRTTGGDEQPEQSYVYLWARVPGVRCS